VDTGPHDDPGVDSRAANSVAQVRLASWTVMWRTPAWLHRAVKRRLRVRGSIGVPWLPLTTKWTAHSGDAGSRLLATVRAEMTSPNGGTLDNPAGVAHRARSPLPFGAPLRPDTRYGDSLPSRSVTPVRRAARLRRRSARR